MVSRVLSNISFSTAESALETPATPNRKIFRAIAVVGLFSAFAILGTMVKELVVAKWFGRSDALDAFLIAFLIPSFLVQLVAGSLNSALIPTFIQVRDTEGREAAQRLFSSVMVWSLGVLVGLAILLGLLAPYYLPLLGSGFGPAKLMLTRRLLYTLLPFVVLSGLVVVWSAVLNAGERFALPAFSPLLTPLTVIAFLVLGSRAWGIFALAAGTVIGSVMEASLLVQALKATGMRLELRWNGLDSHLRRVIHQYAPLLAGTFLMSGTNLVDQSMAAMLQPGSVAALSYGKKMVSAVLAVGATGLGTAALPYFSEMAAKQDWQGCWHTLKTYSRLIVLVSVPLTVGLVLFSSPLVRTLFQRGAFTAQDTNVVSSVQVFLSLQIPFYILGILGVRLISSLKINFLLLVMSAVNLVLDVTFNFLFMKYWGVSGIALSTSVVYLLACTMVYGCIWTVMRRLNREGSPNGNCSL